MIGRRRPHRMIRLTSRPEIDAAGSGSSNADDPSSESDLPCAANADCARSSAVRPDIRAPRSSTPSGITVTYPSLFSSKSIKPERLVNSDSHRGAPRQHRGDHRPRLPQRRRQQDVRHIDSERLSSIRQVPLRVDQRSSPPCHRRTPSRTPPGAAATSGPRHPPSAPRSRNTGGHPYRRPRCAETVRCADRFSDPSAAQVFSAPARPTTCTGSTPHTAAPSRTSRR